jgi:glycosylphosphatidylinositol transamidase (GPIT) subunit GPI8
MSLIVDDATRARGSRLRTSANSKIVVYLTGHGGEGFLKFHDVNELWASSLAEALEIMHAQHQCVAYISHVMFDSTVYCI